MSHDRKMGHVLEFSMYLKVFGALLVLTVVTVYVSLFDFGPLNDVIAILIASFKASLVILFFMHGKFESKQTWAFVYYPIILLLTLLGGLALDYANRTDPFSIKEPPSIAHQAGHHEDAHGNDHEHGPDADHHH